MFRILSVASIILLLLTAVAGAQTPVNLETLAQRLVNQSASVRGGDHVLIVGGTRDLELLEDIAVEVSKLGAFPFITVGSDRLTRRMFTEVASKYDTQFPEWEGVLANFVDAVIAVDFGEAQGLLADIPPERLQARARVAAPIGEIFRRRGVRQVNLGNDLYPTTDRARMFGMTRDELARVFWNGINIDYQQLAGTGQRLRQALAGGRELRITNPNGTDLRVRIEGQPVKVSDGMLSPEAIRRGEKTQVWLPAGEVFLVPLSGTAAGTVVVDRYFFQGKAIEGLRLKFDDGRLTSMSAKSGLEPLQRMYNSADAGKDILGVIDFGINPNVTLSAGMLAWMPAGMVTIGVGNNTWAGGENNVTFGMSPFLAGSTVAVDGKVIVENGQLRL